MPCNLSKCQDLGCELQGQTGKDATVVVRGTVGEAVMTAATYGDDVLTVSAKDIGGGNSLPGVTFTIAKGGKLLNITVSFSLKNGEGELCEVCTNGGQMTLSVLYGMKASDGPAFGYRVRGN